MTTTTSFGEYILPVLRQLQVGIDSLIHDDLGQEVLKIHNERFQGVPLIKDTTPYTPDQPLTESNVPRILSYNNIVRELTNNNIHVLSPEDVVQYWQAIPNKESTYADTDAVAVFPKKGPNEDLRQKVLNLTGKQSTKIPLIVSGLKPTRADNGHGFTFEGTDYMQVTEAPFLQQDGNLMYTNKGLQASEEGVPVWTPQDQSGLRGAYRSGGDVLNVWNGRLLGSSSVGRVHVIQDLQGPAEKIRGLIAQLEKEHEKKMKELDATYAKALEILTNTKR